MRISPVAAALAVVLVSAGGFAHAAGSVIELQTPQAQATKFSQNGQYLVASVFGAGGVRWTSATGVEEPLDNLVYVNGINNLGTVAGAYSTDGGSNDGGHDLPALLPVGAASPTALPLPAGTDNVDVYDVADDGTAVGLAWSDDWAVAKAYYYSPADGVVGLPVTSTGSSRANAISADGHVVVGWNDNDSGRQGVVWIDRVPTYVFDGDGNALGEADGVSGNGQWAVGGGWRMNVQTGEVTTIASLPFAFGVSDDGKTIVGATGFWDYPARALLIWTEAGGSQLLTDYLAERGIAWPADLETPWQGGLTAISGDGKKVAGWLIGPNGNVSIVADGIDAPLDHIFSDGFDPPPPPPVVQDGGFEQTAGPRGPNPYWDSADSNPSAGGISVFYTGMPTHGGGYTAVFGGWGGGDGETQTISQTVTIPAAAPQYLNFYRYAGILPDRAGTLTVSIDGHAIETTDLTTIQPDEDYTLHSIDLGSYADGGQHVIEFKFDYPGGGDPDAGGDGILLIDDVSVDATDAPARVAIGKHVERSRLKAGFKRKH